MSFTIAMIAWGISLTATVLTAGVLAFHDKAGWGWLIFIAALLAMTDIKGGK